jgi:hypothetical protein
VITTSSAAALLVLNMPCAPARTGVYSSYILTRCYHGPATLTPERPRTTDEDGRLPANWPCGGAISISGLSMRYLLRKLCTRLIYPN